MYIHYIYIYIDLHIYILKEEIHIYRRDIYVYIQTNEYTYVNIYIYGLLFFEITIYKRDITGFGIHWKTRPSVLKHGGGNVQNNIGTDNCALFAKCGRCKLGGQLYVVGGPFVVFRHCCQLKCQGDRTNLGCPQTVESLPKWTWRCWTTSLAKDFNGLIHWIIPLTSSNRFGDLNSWSRGAFLHTHLPLQDVCARTHREISC